MAPHACVVPSRAYYKKASKAARAALKVERWKAGAWPGAVRAREVAAARAACAYSGAEGEAYAQREVDHVVSLDVLQAVMWQASLAHCGAKGWLLEWPAATRAWMEQQANSASNLLAVAACAHREKTVLCGAYCALVEEGLRVQQGVRAGMPLLGEHLARQARARRAKGDCSATLRSDFVDVVVGYHRAMATRLLMGLHGVPGAPGSAPRGVGQRRGHAGRGVRSGVARSHCGVACGVALAEAWRQRPTR
jgi:predicted small lipoprotein YifL